MQPAPVRVKDVAAAFNVSERMIYMARWLGENRPDLIPEIEAGRLKLAPAYQQARGLTKPKQSGYDKLEQAWRSATDEERMRFIAQIFEGLALARQRLESGEPSESAEETTSSHWG
ncbi:hypothetical protein [Kaistia hirudinis]|nr:hypothetical protein [Kaistia hirudinis]